MLESLFIRNLVLVPELQLSFGKGFLTVTGETGAGKSLILGALRLLGGARANASLIRHGAKSCEVAGAFLVDGCHAAVAAEIEAKVRGTAKPELLEEEPEAAFELEEEFDVRDFDLDS